VVWSGNKEISGKTCLHQPPGLTFFDCRDEGQLGKNMYNFGRPVFATQMPGASVFRRDEDGAIYHTYSTFAVR